MALGLGGQLIFTAVEAVKDRSKPPGLEPKPGKYRVLFTFARPNRLPLSEGNVSLKEDLEGDSHLLTGFSADQLKHGIKLRLRVSAPSGEEVVLDGTANERGYLSHVETVVSSASPSSAEQLAYRCLAPYLSTIAAQCDVPVLIFRVLIEEVASGIRFVRSRIPFTAGNLTLVPRTQMNEDFRGLVSLYREGLNSNSRLYEFLCMFRITEGIGIRRTRMLRASQKSKTPYVLPSEILPSRSLARWLSALFPGWNWNERAADSVIHAAGRGRPFRDVLEKDLKPIRNEISHVLTSSDNKTLTLDDVAAFEKVDAWLPTLRCMVRRMLKNDFPDQFLPMIREDGSIVGGPTRVDPTVLDIVKRVRKESAEDRS